MSDAQVLEAKASIDTDGKLIYLLADQSLNQYFGFGLVQLSHSLPINGISQQERRIQDLMIHVLDCEEPMVRKVFAVGNKSYQGCYGVIDVHSRKKIRPQEVVPLLKQTETMVGIDFLPNLEDYLRNKRLRGDKIIIANTDIAESVRDDVAGLVGGEVLRVHIN